jgi:hypothetical protein
LEIGSQWQTDQKLPRKSIRLQIPGQREALWYMLFKSTLLEQTQAEIWSCTDEEIEVTNATAFFGTFDAPAKKTRKVVPFSVEADVMPISVEADDDGEGDGTDSIQDEICENIFHGKKQFYLRGRWCTVDAMGYLNFDDGVGSE